jgi:hypothetical protein
MEGDIEYARFSLLRRVLRQNLQILVSRRTGVVLICVAAYLISLQADEGFAAVFNAFLFLGGYLVALHGGVLFLRRRRAVPEPVFFKLGRSPRRPSRGAPTPTSSGSLLQRLPASPLISCPGVAPQHPVFGNEDQPNPVPASPEHPPARGR